MSSGAASSFYWQSQAKVFSWGAKLPAQPGTLEPTPLTWLAQGESGCWRGAPGPPGAVTPRGWGGPRGG